MSSKKEETVRKLLTSLAVEYEATREDEKGVCINHILGGGDWSELLNERDGNEALFATMYADEFAHGTAGHNRLMLIAKLCTMLDTYEAALEKMTVHIMTGEM